MYYTWTVASYNLELGVGGKVLEELVLLLTTTFLGLEHVNNTTDDIKMRGEEEGVRRGEGST